MNNAGPTTTPHVECAACFYQASIQDSRFQDQDQNQDSMNNMAKLMQIT